MFLWDSDWGTNQSLSFEEWIGKMQELKEEDPYELYIDPINTPSTLPYERRFYPKVIKNVSSSTSHKKTPSLCLYIFPSVFTRI